jgi:hypothetical protein
MSRTLGLLGLEPCQVGALDQAAKGLEGEDLSFCGDEHLLHVFGTNAKPPAGNAGDDLVFLLAGWHAGGAQRAEVLDARYLVPGGTVVLGYLGFNDDLWAEFVRHYEIGGLIKAGQLFSALGLSIADPGFCQRKSIGSQGCRLPLRGPA